MQRVVKIIFIHDDGYSREKCQEFIMTPIELSKEEIKKILYSTKPYNDNDSIIDIIEIIPMIPLNKPYVL